MKNNHNILQLIGDWFTKRRLRKYIKTCNLDVTKRLIVKKFSGAVISNELASIFNEFVANPCFDTALKLILFDSKFLNFFELSKKGGFTEKLFRDTENKL
jgi:hypothetical protein